MTCHAVHSSAHPYAVLLNSLYEELSRPHCIVAGREKDRWTPTAVILRFVIDCEIVLSQLTAVSTAVNGYDMRRMLHNPPRAKAAQLPYPYFLFGKGFW